MEIKKLAAFTWMLLLYMTSSLSYAQLIGSDGLGQTIQIYTRFRSFVGKPTLLLVIRDLDNGQNIPYVFDIVRGDNFWFLFTHSRNYLIQAANLQIHTYNSRCNDFRSYRINNFCHLESNGRIIRGESLYITIDGDLTPNMDSVRCNISQFPDTNFTIANTTVTTTTTVSTTVSP